MPLDVAVVVVVDIRAEFLEKPVVVIVNIPLSICCWSVVEKLEG